MKVLITGINGYIGNRLFSVLKQHNFSVSGTVRDTEMFMCKECNQLIVTGDISSFNNWHQVLSDIDIVIHLAGMAHIFSEPSDKSRMLENYRVVNRNATLRLAQGAVDAGVRRFIYISSIGVLGNTTIDKIFNNRSKYNPQESYAVSKMEAELGLKKIEELSNIEVVIVRPPLVYGPRHSGNFYRLLKLVDIGLPLPLPLGGMKAKKSMISLDNLCSLLIKTITEPLPKYSKLVVSDGSYWSTAELVSLIAEYMGKKKQIFTVPRFILNAFGSLVGKREEVRKLSVPLQVDGSETAEILNWSPIQSPEDGLKEAVEYYLVHK